MYDQINSSSGSLFYINCARRIGKSFMLCVLAIEYALRNPESEIKYAAPTAKSVKKIIRPHFTKILKDCPPHLRPRWSALDGEYIFPNGSTITVAGCDNQNYETLRGTSSSLNIVDEAGFIDDLKYVVEDVLTPMTIDTNGKTIIASTPPRSPAHPAIKLMEQCQTSGDYCHRTIFDCPRLSKNQVDNFIRKQAAGRTIEEFTSSTTFRREYLAEIVIDESSAVIPEFTAEKEAELVRDFRVSDYADRYTSLDVGWKDGMAAVFAVWDANDACLYIQDEYLQFKITTGTLAASVREIERQLWYPFPPYLRIADNDLLLIHDLSSDHGLTFIPTAKDDKELQVNALRQMVAANKVVIHPRCKKLIRQLHSTVWNKARSSYERNAEGHGDLVDALVYLVRNIRRSRLQTPPGQYDPYNMYVPRKGFKSASGTGAAVLNLFTRRG